jgi:hypothetical protein
MVLSPNPDAIRVAKENEDPQPDNTFYAIKYIMKILKTVIMIATAWILYNLAEFTRSIFAEKPCPLLSEISTNSGETCFRLKGADLNFHAFVDFNSQSDIWIRLNYKNGSNFQASTIQNDILDYVQDFGISDNLTTMNTNNSWIVRGAQFSCPRVVSDPSEVPARLENEEDDCHEYFQSFLEGKTPTGISWSSQYNQAFLYIEGKLDTHGKWKSMYEGVDYESYLQVGENVKFRTGGAPWNEGEFIHSKGNGYNPNKDHSITALVDWSTQRVFWFKPKNMNNL